MAAGCADACGTRPEAVAPPSRVGPWGRGERQAAAVELSAITEAASAAQRPVGAAPVARLPLGLGARFQFSSVSEYSALSSLNSGAAGGGSPEEAWPSSSESPEVGVPGMEKSKPGDGVLSAAGADAWLGLRAPETSRGGVGCRLAAPGGRAGRCCCTGCLRRVPSGPSGGGLLSFGLKGQGCDNQASAAHWVRGCAAVACGLAACTCGRAVRAGCCSVRGC